MAKTSIPSNNNIIRIGLMGDIMLGRAVNEMIDRANYAYPWGNMLPLLKDLDINLINLETTLTKSSNKVPKTFNFKADPDKIQCLKEAKIDVCNLANNHILDFSKEGLIETISTLDAAGIKHVGAGINVKEAAKPAIIKKGNSTIGIIGCTDNEPKWQAGKNKTGVNYIKIGNRKEIKKQIMSIRHKVDILIFTIHWGPNMRRRPTEDFKNFAREVIDLGVDIFHGHSAHIFQGIEIYQDKLILYDSGDFIDDYYVNPSLRNDQSFLTIVYIEKREIKKIELIPTLISHMQTNKAFGDDYQEILSRMKKLSKELGTKIVKSKKGIFI